MPWTIGAFTLGSLGLVGIPPINGFFSKWFLCLGSLQAGWPMVLALFILSGLLNAAYLLPVVYRGFFRKSEEFAKFDEAPPLMVVPLCTTAALALVLGLFPNLFFDFFELASGISEMILAS